MKIKMALDKFEDLKGHILKKVVGKIGGDQVLFELDNGEKYGLQHADDCCESVDIEDICGNLDDLIGLPILLAEESTNSEKHPDGVILEYEPESFTWTFYRLQTEKGFVTIRWYGTSSGYYSESVSFNALD
jgi:hypothetical protein